MKNFCDLLDTDHWIDIEILTPEGVTTLRGSLLENLELTCRDPISVKVDGMEMLGFGYEQSGIWQIRLDEPFYRWRHRVTGQGWLLDPVKSTRPRPRPT